MSYNHTLTGVTLVKDGNTLGYPFVQNLRSLAELCDEVLVNVGYGSDDTIASVFQLQRYYPSIRVFQNGWDMKNTGDGSELAKQANIVLNFAQSDWVIYLQADELIHEDDMHSLRIYLDSVPSSVTQIELLRTYFWGDLQHRAPKYEIYLGRIFRTGTHTVGGDGMYLVRNKGEIQRSPYFIYHYSRIGPEDKVAARVKNLDRLFHDDVSTTPTFTYNTEVNLVHYVGTHPHGIEEFYAV
jgi:hypothetical protein